MRKATAATALGVRSAETQWRDRVEAWRASGQSMREFASASGVKVSTLRWWSSRLGRRAAVVAQAPGPQIVQLIRRPEPRPDTAKAPQLGVIVEVGAARIRVEPGFDAALLSEVVRALAESSR